MRKLSVSYRLLLWLLLFALAASLIPLLVLGFYAAPSSDDYSFSVQTRAAFVESGSLPRTLAAAADKTREIYRDWQGSFSAVFLMALQPAIFGARWYALTPALMLASLLSGLFVCCDALFSRLWGLPRSLSACVAAVLALLCIQLMPSPVDGLYWYNGAVYYTFFHGLALAAVGLGLRLSQSGRRRDCLLLCLLALLLGGSNYVTCLCCALLAVGGTALLLLLRRRTWRMLLLPTLCLLAAFAVNAASPGTDIRMDGVAHTPQVLPSILASFCLGAEYSLRWLSLPLVGALVFLGALLWPAVAASRFAFRWPLLPLLGSYCLFSAMFCPFYFVFGSAGPNRMLNILYDSYVLLLVCNLCYLLGWLARKRRAAAPRGVRLTPLLACGALCLLCCLLYTRVGGFTSLMALGELRSGEPACYRAACEQRAALLEQADADTDLTVPPLPYSYLLYFTDVSDDAEAWDNRCLAAYYGRKSVRLETPG